MTESWRYAAVHLGYTEVSVVATGGPLEGPRECVGSAFATVGGGRLVFGRADVAAEIPPLLCIDDQYIAVGTSVWNADEVLHGIVWSALQSAGVHDRLDVLEIAYPSFWGDERTAFLRTTFAASANEVVLVETTAAAIESAGERAPSAAVVVEVGALDTSVLVLDATGAHGGDTGAMVPFGVADDDAWRRGVGDFVRSSVPHCPAEVFVVGSVNGEEDPIVDRSTTWLTGLDVARALYRRAGADLGSVPSARAGTTRSAAWLDDVTVPPPRRNPVSSRIAVIGAAITVVSVCAALYLVSSSPDGAEPAAVQPFSPAVPSVTSAPMSSVDAKPDTESADAPVPVRMVTFVSGRASMRLPDTWTRLDDPERMVVIPSTPPDRRIVVTVADLTPGSTQEQVAADLRSAIEARGPESAVGSLESARDFGGRRGIAYTETPIDDSTVLWRVFVESDLQVSIGCQFEGDDVAVIAAECDQATQSLEIVAAT